MYYLISLLTSTYVHSVPLHSMLALTTKASPIVLTCAVVSTTSHPVHAFINIQAFAGSQRQISFAARRIGFLCKQITWGNRATGNGEPCKWWEMKEIEIHTAEFQKLQQMYLRTKRKTTSPGRKRERERDLPIENSIYIHKQYNFIETHENKHIYCTIGMDEVTLTRRHYHIRVTLK